MGSALGGEVKEEKPWPFLDQYSGKGIENLMLTGDGGEGDTKIVKITGVTISSNAATQAAKKALGKILDGLR
jgi:hypothetical protein